MPSRSALLDRRQQLQSEVRAEKAAIARHKRILRTKAAALAALEAECRRHGLQFVYHPRSSASSGVGGIHGRPSQSEDPRHHS